MPERPKAPNYPDILGYVTDGISMTVNTVQAALALRPPVAHAGRPFGVVVLLQNLADVPAEVQVLLRIPARDRAGNKERFKARPQVKLVMRPAEVGYLLMPVQTAPDTAPGRDYLIEVEVQSQPLARPRRIRRPADEAEVNLDYYFALTDDALLRVVALKMLTFVGAIPKRLLSGDKAVMAVEQVVVPAKRLPPTHVKAGWYSLWALTDDTDARPLLERFGRQLLEDILPRLDTLALYQALLPLTEKRFSRAYDIQPIEVHYITKLLVYLLRLSYSPPPVYYFPQEADFNLHDLLARGWPSDGHPIPLPRWCRGLLRVASMDAEAAANPQLAVTGALYDDLLYDAVTFGFQMVQYASGEELGDAIEIRDYTELLLKSLLQADRRLSFGDVYLPLVLAGAAVSEEVRLPDEKPLDQLHQLIAVYEARKPAENTPENASVFALTEDVLHWASLRYTNWM